MLDRVASSHCSQDSATLRTRRDPSLCDRRGLGFEPLVIAVPVSQEEGPEPLRVQVFYFVNLECVDRDPNALEIAAASTVGASRSACPRRQGRVGVPVGVHHARPSHQGVYAAHA